MGFSAILEKFNRCCAAIDWLTYRFIIIYLVVSSRVCVLNDFEELHILLYYIFFVIGYGYTNIFEHTKIIFIVCKQMIRWMGGNNLLSIDFNRFKSLLFDTGSIHTYIISSIHHI